MLGMLIYGLINSAVFMLMAIGFSLTFGISGVANFAYGAFYVTGAYIAWQLINSLGLSLLILVCPVPYKGPSSVRDNSHFWNRDRTAGALSKPRS
jgi:branched-subunit amino acid ABC-type transport system permease component